MNRKALYGKLPRHTPTFELTEAEWRTQNAMNMRALSVADYEGIKRAAIRDSRIRPAADSVPNKSVLQMGADEYRAARSALTRR